MLMRGARSNLCRPHSVARSLADLPTETRTLEPIINRQIAKPLLYWALAMQTGAFPYPMASNCAS